MKPNLLCLSLILVVSGCVVAPADDVVGTDAPRAASVLAFDAQASPQGAISVFDWVVPDGSSQGPDEAGYYELHLAFAVRSSSGSALQEWWLLLFDQFDGPAGAELWRPIYYFGSSPMERFEGLPRMTKSADVPLEHSHRDSSYNRTSFDGRRLAVVVLAKGPAQRVAFLVDVLEDAGFFESELPRSGLHWLEDADAGAMVPTRANGTGFEIHSFQQWVDEQSASMLKTHNVMVERSASVGAIDALRVSSEHSSDSGWALTKADLGGWARAGDYELSVLLRGQGLEASGPIAETPAGDGPGLRQYTHFGYRNGVGPNRFDLRIRYASAPYVESMDMFRLDVDERMDRLLGGPTYDHWQVRGTSG